MTGGGLGRNAKGSSPPLSGVSVGGVRVLGARESRVQGEGHQEFAVLLSPLAALAPGIWDNPPGAGCERERDHNAERDLSSEMPNSGEPGAVKVARRVRKGG